MTQKYVGTTEVMSKLTVYARICDECGVEQPKGVKNQYEDHWLTVTWPPFDDDGIFGWRDHPPSPADLCSPECATAYIIKGQVFLREHG